MGSPPGQCGRSSQCGTPNITTVSQAGNQVTIAGSNFGAAQNNGQVWLGTAYGIVQTWSDGQIVAQVAAGSSSGKVQVLQNGVWSNALPFTISTLRITSVSPVSGAAGTQVTFAGTGFGSSASNGIAWLGSAAGNVISWSDTQVVATVATGAVSGVARIQQNGVWSNAVGFTVPVSGGGGNTLTPAMLNMVVGETHTIGAVDATGQPVTGLTWISSNPAVVGLSSDDPPVLTALAPGRATITAGTGSADVTVWAGPLPGGTTLWTNPSPWATVSAIVPAVPSPTGVADVFAFNCNSEDLGIAAITSDGATAWTANWSHLEDEHCWSLRPVPDFQGGLLAVVNTSVTEDYEQIVKLDGLTGQVHVVYTSPVGDVSLDPPVPHPDGTVFDHMKMCYHDGSWPSCADWVVGVDSATGGQKFNIPLGLEGPNGGRGAYFVSLIVAGDGYAYALYFAPEWTDAHVYVMHLMVLRVATDGTYSNMELKSWTSPDGTRGWSGGLISNGDQGVAVTWHLDVIENPFNPATDAPDFGMALVSGSGVTVVSVNGPLIPGQDGAVVPELQAQDGSFVGIAYLTGGGYEMVAFDATGAVRWVVPNERPAIATADGGVIGQSGVIYDQNGSATGQMAGLPKYSWKGAYQIGSVDSILPQFDLAVLLAQTYTATRGGNLTGNGFSLVHRTFGLFFCGPDRPRDGACTDPATQDMKFAYLPNISDSNYTQAADFSPEQPTWPATIKNQALEQYKSAFLHLPAIVAGKYGLKQINNATAPARFDHTVYISGHWLTPTEYPRSDAPYPPNGYTPNPKISHYSWAYYLPIMGNAQSAIGCLDPLHSCSPVSPAYTNPPAVQFNTLIPAIGYGIGAIAAHETAHQILPRSLMDCVNNCEAPDVYEAAASDGANHPWFYTDSAKKLQGEIAVPAHVHWSQAAGTALGKYLLGQTK